MSENNYIIIDNIDQKLSQKLDSFYKSYDVVSEQLHYFPLDQTGKILYYISFNKNDEIDAYARIVTFNIKKIFNKAIIYFGPITNNELILKNLIQIINKLKEIKIDFLEIQLPLKISDISEFIEINILNNYKCLITYNSKNWTSIELNLDKEIEDIKKNFSKGHKSAITKARKLGLKLLLMTTREHFNIASKLYVNMLKNRNICCDNEATIKNFNDLYEFYNKTNKMFGFLVEYNNSFIGFALFLKQGKNIRYYKSASDVQYRDLPIMHLLIWEAIQYSKRENYKVFDFWGYNHYVTKNDQIYHINIFKKGFGGNYTFYSKLLKIILNKKKYYIYTAIKFLYDILAKYIINKS